MAARARIFCCLKCCLKILSIGFLMAASRVNLGTAHAKIERIEYDSAPAGITILSSAELAAYATEQAEIVAPGAVRDIHLSLWPAHAEASARINFIKVRQTEGVSDNWVMRQLLDGDRPVRVRVRLQSSHGRARVDVERVEVSGVAMEGSTLAFLLRRFVIPNFPGARAGEWFELRHNIDRLDVGKALVRVTIRKRR